MSGCAKTCHNRSVHILSNGAYIDGVLALRNPSALCFSPATAAARPGWGEKPIQGLMMVMGETTMLGDVFFVATFFQQVQAPK